MRLDTLYYRGYLRSCNYSCSYCPFHKKTLSRQHAARKESQMSVAETLRRDQRGLERFCAKAAKLGSLLSVMLIPYGEALIYPYYHEAMARLCKAETINKIGCQTNLSFSVEDLLMCLDSGSHDGSLRAKLRLWCTFHPSQTSLDVFLGQCRKLYHNKIRFSVGVVGIPKYIDMFGELRRKLPRNIYLWVNAAEGMNTTYTPAEIKKFLDIDPLFYHELADYPARPALCRGGKESLFVEGNGDAFACPISRKRLGNIYTDLSATFHIDEATKNLSMNSHADEHSENLFKNLHRDRHVDILPTPSHIDEPIESLSTTSVDLNLCRATSCHCYLAYSNRRDIFNVSGLNEERTFRVPNQQRAFFFDIDGTLTNTSGTIPDENRYIIECLARENLVFLATSLPFRYAKHTCREIWQHIAGGVFAEGSDIRVFEDKYKKIIPLDASVQDFLEQGYKLAGADPHTQSAHSLYREEGILHKITLQNHTPLEKALRELHNQNLENPQIHCVYEDKTCGIVAKEASKLKGILEICRHLQLFEPFVTVVGNSQNDVPMLRYFSDSVCMPESEGAVKNAAKRVCMLKELENSPYVPKK